MNIRQAKKIGNKATYQIMPVGRIVKALRVLWHHKGRANRLVHNNTAFAIARECNNFARAYERRIK